MPRTARLDIPGLLQHVMVRGIEKSPIFLDDEDRTPFVERFSKLRVETDTQCYAWALRTNHFHLLIVHQRDTLARFMRRLLTGYVVTFNRHDSGKTDIKDSHIIHRLVSQGAGVTSL